jgi:hypothetical protein
MDRQFRNSFGSGEKHGYMVFETLHIVFIVHSMPFPPCRSPCSFATRHNIFPGKSFLKTISLIIADADGASNAMPSGSFQRATDVL